MTVETENKVVREDSLIKSYTVEESELKVYKHKVVFTTVKDIKLAYYTNTQSFMELLGNFKDNFIITYEFAKGSDIAEGDTKRVIKVKLPKVPKK